MVSYSQSPLFAILAVFLTVLAVAFALAARRWRLEPDRRRFVRLVAAAVAMAVVASLLGYGVYADYVRRNSWTFTYRISVQGSVFPDAVIVPAVADEGLLAGLVLESGAANWSLMDTLHGRGLYVAFTANASLSAYASRFPPPVPPPDVSLTMTNATGTIPEVWIWHAGSAALSLYFSENSQIAWPSEIGTGWQSCRILYAPTLY